MTTVNPELFPNKLHAKNSHNYRNQIMLL